MKHHLKVEIKAEDTQSLEQQLKEVVETCNINLALACKCGGYNFSEKAGEDQTVIEWRCFEDHEESANNWPTSSSYWRGSNGL